MPLTQASQVNGGRPVLGGHGVPLALLVVSLLALIDAALGAEVVIIGLLTVGPCLAAVWATPRSVALVGGYAGVLTALLCWWPDDLWGTRTMVFHLLGVVLITGISMLVADRRRSLAAGVDASRELEERLAAIVSSSSDAIIGKTLDGTITSWNFGAEAMYGYRSEEVVGRNISVLVPPDRDHELPRVLAQVARGQRVEPFDTVRVTKSGEQLHISLSVSPVHDASGRIIGASAMGRDTTERARVLAELRSSEARKTAVLESSMDALVTIDEHGTVVEFNPAAERVFGYSRAEAMGRLLADLIIPPALREAHRAGLARYLETGEGPLLGLRLDLTAVRSDGSELPVEVTITKVDLPGRPLFTGSLRDMTEERRTEAERANLTSRLHQADRLDSLGQLAGGVAHDFNNLLAVILNHASLVDREVTDDRTRKDVAAISEAAQRAAGLTRQLLAFSRAEPITDVVVDVDTVAQPVSELLRRTLPENITLLTRFAPDAWHVRGDPTRIEQLVMNLAINARDAMPDGGRLTIETANEHLDELSAASSVNLRPGRYVRLSVSDSGTGMSREVREHAFEPFYSTKPKGRGTGLGLATVYGIMRQLGGAASIYSELGRGTTVMLHLPAADEPAQGYVAPPVPRPRASGGDRHVLLLEDEDLLREAIGRVLRNAGYTVTALATGEEALAAFDGGGGQALDLVVSDVTLPGVSGPEVVNRLRAHRPEVPALFMSGYTENALAGQEPGRLHLLEKPFTLDALLARAEELLGVAEETGR